MTNLTIWETIALLLTFGIAFYAGWSLRATWTMWREIEARHVDFEKDMQQFVDQCVMIELVSKR